MPTTSTRRKARKAAPAAVAQPCYEVDETTAFLALSAIKGVGYWTLRKLREQGITFAQVLEESSEAEVRRILKAAGAQLAKKEQRDWEAARQAITKRAATMLGNLADNETQVILRGEAAFPGALEDLPDPPYWLFVQGDVKILKKPSVAIVGTRSPTDEGLWLAKFVGLCLQDINAPTVSGLANGIDQLVHRASIRAGVPTLAVLGNGIFHDYPKGSEKLRAEIIAHGGAIVTEYLPNQTYSAENFVRRNRLQAALARVLVPVEWQIKSGTAHTVKYASDLKRPIACLRIPDQTWDTSPYRSIKTESELFTVPGQEKEFRQYLKKALKRKASNKRAHPDLFA